MYIACMHVYITIISGTKSERFIMKPHLGFSLIQKNYTWCSTTLMNLYIGFGYITSGRELSIEGPNSCIFKRTSVRVHITFAWGLNTLKTSSLTFKLVNKA